MQLLLPLGGCGAQCGGNARDNNAIQLRGREDVADVLLSYTCVKDGLKRTTHPNFSRDTEDPHGPTCQRRAWTCRSTDDEAPRKPANLLQVRLHTEVKEDTEAS